MNTKIPNTVTIYEAVARLINLDYIPEGYTFDQITESFSGYTQGLLEETDELNENDILQLERIAEICELRHELALKLKESIDYEIKRANTKVRSNAAPYSPHLEINAIDLDDWCSMTFGISLIPYDLIQREDQEKKNEQLKDKYSRMPEITDKPETRATKYDNLSRTFYVLTTMYAKIYSNKYYIGDKLNISQISESISEKTREILGSNKGQSTESIKDRIEYAAHIIPNRVRQ